MKTDPALQVRSKSITRRSPTLGSQGTGASRRTGPSGAWVHPALALALVVLAAPACVTEPPPERSAEAIRYRMPQDPPTLDPHDAPDENANFYVYNVFDGLVEFAPGSLEVVPAVAESWEASADGMMYTFRLRPRVRFHNGREVVADDVVYSLRRALEKGRRAAPREVLLRIEGAAEFAEGSAAEVAGLSAPDARTVVIRLSKPTGHLLMALATQSGSIVPREVYEDPDKRYLRHPVGSGPFEFGEYASGRHLTMTAFEDHWKGRPPLPGIVVRIIPDANTALLEYRSGGLDICNEVPAGQRKPVAEELGTQYRIQPRLATAYLLINHASGPLSGSPALRRALNFGIDRERIASVLQENKDEATSWILPEDLAGGREGSGPFSYDVAEARRLLEEAGYPGGKGLPALTILTSTNESIRNSSVSIQNDLREMGIKVNLESLDFAAFTQALFGAAERGPSADMIVLLWFADYPDPEVMIRQLFHSGSGSNFSRYHNPEVDDLLDAADGEGDPTRRLRFFLDAEEAILADGGVIPLYHQGDDLLVKPGITGVTQSPLGDFAIPLEMAGIAP